MRLIDADALKEMIPFTSVDMFGNCRNCSLLSDEQVNELIDMTPTIMEISCEQDGPMLVYLPEGWQRDPINRIILFYDDGKSVEYSEERYDMKQRGDDHEA